jgi:hypothetical protein
VTTRKLRREVLALLCGVLGVLLASNSCRPRAVDPRVVLDSPFDRPDPAHIGRPSPDRVAQYVGCYVIHAPPTPRDSDPVHSVGDVRSLSLQLTPESGPWPSQLVARLDPTPPIGDTVWSIRDGAAHLFWQQTRYAAFEFRLHQTPTGLEASARYTSDGDPKPPWQPTAIRAVECAP